MGKNLKFKNIKNYKIIPIKYSLYKFMKVYLKKH